MVAPAIIAAGIAGGALLGSTAMTTFGGGSGTQSGLHQDDWILWKKNELLQKEFAKKGLQWRVQDGAKAGLSPLASVGVQGAQGIPISIGSSNQYKESKSDRVARAMAKGGNDISRAISQLPSDLEIAQTGLISEQTRKLAFENNLLEQQINSKTQPQLSGTLGIDLPPDEQLLRENPQRYKADSIGVQKGGVHGKQAMFDEHGNLDFGLNQLTSEAYESDPVNQLKMVKRQLVHYANLAWGRPIDTPSGVVPFKTFVRKQAKFLNTKYKYQGFKIGYSPAERGFRLVKANRVMPSGFIRSKARSYKIPLYKGSFKTPTRKRAHRGW